MARYPIPSSPKVRPAHRIATHRTNRINAILWFIGAAMVAFS
ncbi:MULTISPECIES: hypothetical protein [Rhizobium]|nr:MULTISPECIES: hypothetical protein [Rhizobium]